MSIPQPQLTYERRSAVLTILLLLVALLLGWWVKTAVQNATRTLDLAGFTADVPEGWLVQEGVGDLAFLARNPLALDELYRVSLVPATGELDAVAENRILARARLDNTYRLLTAEPIVFAGQDGYKVSFARVDLDSPGLPHVVEGLDYYFVQADEVMVLSLEAHSEHFAGALPAFQQFVQSVTYHPGE
ncbi:MAG: hypothetical protein IPM53_04225 [Anaerolineaceae bacterium]|nr:hypothetical protein [Anaerolineaceae bacterium]